MQSKDANKITDPEIGSYLLGVADEEVTETIDELTFIDDDFVARVGGIECDLIDEYIRDELDEESRRRFEEHYLRTPLRRERVRLGERFAEFAARSGSHPAPADTKAVEKKENLWQTFWRRFGIPALAAAALLAAAIPIWYLTRQHGSNRIASGNENIDSPPATLQPEPAQTAPREVPATVTAASPTEEPTEPGSKPDPEPTRAAPREAPRVFAVTLMPQTRSSSGETTISPPAGTDRIAATLRLEPTKSPRIGIELRELATQRVVWRTTARPSKISGAYQSLRVTVPSKLLSAGRYSFAATIQGEGGEPEVIGEFPFRISQ